MGLFKKLFKRKKKDGSSSAPTKAAAAEAEQPGTRSNTPEAQEAYQYHENLSRITEEPTMMSELPPSGYRSPDDGMEKLHHPDPKPSAREAAFHGPPRFGWVDIVRTVFVGLNTASVALGVCLMRCVCFILVVLCRKQ